MFLFCFYFYLGLKAKRAPFVFNADEVRGMKPLRIVFVFTVTGRAVRQIRRLLKAIYHVDHYYYLHVDSVSTFQYSLLTRLQIPFFGINMSLVMRKPALSYAKTKAQIASLFSLHRKHDPSSFYIRTFKPLAIFCDCTARLMSDPVGNPEDRFSRYAAQLYLHVCPCIS